MGFADIIQQLADEASNIHTGRLNTCNDLAD